MPDPDSPLERLRKRLYAPSQPQAPAPVAPSSAPRPVEGWAAPSAPAPKPASRISPSAYFLMSAAGFFVVASILAVLFLFFGTRSVSTDRVDVRIDGPTSIASGDTVQLIVSVENRNPAPIHATLLSIEYPEGTSSADEASEPLVRYSDTMGDIMPGERATRTARAVLSGSANQIVTIPVTFEYAVEGSNATFVKREQYTFTITSSPVNLSVSTLNESPSGQEVTVTTVVRTNGVDPVSNVAVLAEYPFGFTPTRSDPQPSAGNLFFLGPLQPGEEKRITVSGTLTGQQGDERVFRFTAGTPKGGGSQSLAVTYTAQEATVRITRPFLAVSLLLNRQEQETVTVRAGEPISANLSWSNTLPVSVQDAEIRVTLGGNALLARNVTAAGGFYRSSDQTVVFNRETTRDLLSLEPGGSGGASFSVPLKSGSELSVLNNPVVTFTVSVSGRRVGESGVPETVTSTLTKTARISTQLSLSSRAVRTTGPFTNTGSWPPVEDQSTTYTILLTAQNSVNSVGGTRVTATLPSYVSFTGQTSPADGSVSYNATTREVTWVVGDLPSNGSKQAAFQVSLLPSSSQRGTSPVLVYPQSITGTDRFLQTQLTGSAPAVDTRTTTDPGYRSDYGEVRE